ncbi:hypothetical protein, partial [Shimia sp.]|uniref:hypothetical protein n=1 Tax=Shimia sp. TaxID=1954381 RepID=UPI003569D3F0
MASDLDHFVHLLATFGKNISQPATKPYQFPLSGGLKSADLPQFKGPAPRLLYPGSTRFARPPAAPRPRR